MPVAEYTEDIFSSPVQTLIVPVNCVGAMGRGLALEFKERVPGLYTAYRKLCRSGRLQPHQLWRYAWPGTQQQVICLPTKYHWRDHSDRNQVLANLSKLVALHEKLNIQSLALPAVGCGEGGLVYEELRDDMMSILSILDCDVRIVFKPLG